jgi:subtilisin family serine protease
MFSSKLISLVSASALVLAGGLAGTASMAAPIKSEAASANKNKQSNSVYIVRMADDPVVAYKGGIKGYAATAPKKGQKIDPDNPNVQKYFGYLAGKHDQALGKVGGANKLYDYGYAFNGFAAELTKAQAAKLKATAGVLSVEKDEARKLDTATTPHFLKLDEPGGLWDQLGGVGSAGEDIIIGIVDGGAWPEHPSFSDRTGSNGNSTKNGKLSYQQIPGWHGKCTPGEAFTAANCNQKLIGARYYNSGWGGNAGIDAQLPWEFNSPRDLGGHGTHTATTAGGNNNVTITGTPAALGKMSGIAPRARIAAYKVCWETGEGGSCFSSDSVAAIDQAVADGVDVINYSVSGSRTNFLDSVEVAFLFAADAGVFVATSAGNSGPNYYTVAHPGPWLTSVAAGTHDRYYEADATLGNGSTYRGASTNQGGVPSTPIVYSAEVGAAGADPTEAQLCYPGTLDAAKVAGKIVLCDRGVIARVDKSLAVAMAGGVGSILANTSASSLNADFHSVPTVHVDHIAGSAIRAYVAGNASATASIASSFFSPVPAPFTASFSSRGPLLASGDLIKPDVMAPGVDIMAGVAPPGNGGELFASYQGTSMSSPHVAGLAALLKDLHPNWSPMMIKSALMTTAYNVNGSSGLLRTLQQGAGFVAPNKAADPGLVFDAGWIDWLGFLCGTGQLQASYCPAIGIDPSDLNVASIAIGPMVGSQKVTRTVTSVGTESETYTVASSVGGFAVTVNPASFTIRPGQTQKIEITLTDTGVPKGCCYAGSITWSGDKGHQVRIPVQLEPVEFAAPAEVSGSGASGATSFDITFGYAGDYSAGTHGLNAASTIDGNVPDDPGNEFAPGGPGTVAYDIVVPAGTALARFSLFDAYTDGDDDLDLYVYLNGTQVGGSGSGTSAERVDIVLPEAGTYTVYVHGWGTDGPDANFTLFSWNVGLVDDAGNMTVTAPAAAVFGATETVGVSWDGLATGAKMKYLGAVSHTGDSGLLGLTIVSIDAD